MRLRAKAVALVSLVTAFAFWPAPGNAAQPGASVENIRFEHDSQVAFVQVVNHSQKKITALNLSVDVTFINSKMDHFEQMLDLMSLIVNKEIDEGVKGGGCIAAGESREIRIDTVTPISSIRAKVDMVAYLDLSAEVDGNQDALKRLMSARKDRALAAQQVALVINEAAANTVTPDPRGMAIHQLRTLLSEAVSKHDSNLESELRITLSDLQSNAFKTDLRGYARRKNDAAEAELVHANIRRTN